MTDGPDPLTCMFDPGQVWPEQNLQGGWVVHGAQQLGWAGFRKQASSAIGHLCEHKEKPADISL